MSKVERPYSPSTHIPEPEVEQPMGVKARVLGTLLHPQLYARFLPRSIILKFTLFFQSCSWTLLVGVPRRRGCYPESLHSVPLRSLHCKRSGSDSNPGSYAYICDWRLFYGWSVSLPEWNPKFLDLICWTGRVVAGWICDRSWLHPISIASLHRHRPRPSLLPRLLHHLPCLHRLHKFVRLADRLLDRSHVSHLRPPPRPPAALSCLLLPHSRQRTRHTLRTSTGRRSCGQISGQVMDDTINLYNPDFYSTSPDLQQSIWRLQLCFRQPFSFLLQTS